MFWILGEAGPLNHIIPTHIVMGLVKVINILFLISKLGKAKFTEMCYWLEVDLKMPLSRLRGGDSVASFTYLMSAIRYLRIIYKCNIGYMTFHVGVECSYFLILHSTHCTLQRTLVLVNMVLVMKITMPDSMHFFSTDVAR